MKFNLCCLSIFFILEINLIGTDAESIFGWLKKKERKAWQRTPKYVKSLPSPEFKNGKEGIEAELALLNLYFGFVDRDRRQNPTFKSLFIDYEKMKEGKLKF